MPLVPISFVHIYIYIYAFSRRFYPKRLTLHSSYSFTFYQLLLSLGIEPMILALLAPCSTIWATGNKFIFNLNEWASRIILVFACGAKNCKVSLALVSATENYPLSLLACICPLKTSDYFFESETWMVIMFYSMPTFGYRSGDLVLTFILNAFRNSMSWENHAFPRIRMHPHPNHPF